MVCKHCGCNIESGYENLREDTCFTCNYWLDQASSREDAVVYKGVHRRISDEATTSPFRGCGGAKFRVIFNDDREVFSTNMWYQGKIPQHMLHLFPDNVKVFEQVS